MEDKQLNLNQPLLSVRRISSTTTTGSKDDKRTTDISSYTVPRPPLYKSELKSGPVSNPGVVPFLWERSPGRPKDEASPQTDNRFPIVPRLPPGRTLKADPKNVTKAPQSPTIAKSEMENVPRESQHFQPSSRKVNKPGSFGSSSDTVEDEEKFESADEDETYVDALDTLSRTESFFLNCSVSGLSGLDEPERSPLGAFPTDPQTRGFMIDRFLPAAKAMASDMTSEVPQYAPRKQPVVHEQPQQPKKGIKADRRPQLRYGPSFAKHYYQSHDYAKEGSDDDNDENEHVYLPPKACGLLPRFCLKSPFFLMNPVPGMRTQVPMSPISKTQTRSSSAGSCSGTENERSISDGSEQQSVFGLLTAEPYESTNDLEDEFKMKTTRTVNDHKLDGSSTYKELSGNGISAYHDEPPQRYDMKASLSTRGKSDNTGQSNATQEDSGNPVVEKTLYVDTMHKVESLIQLIKEDCEILTEKIGQKPLDFPFSEDGNLNSVEKGTKIKPVVQETLHLIPLFSADKLNSEVRRKPRKAYGKADLFYKGSNVKLDSEVDESSIKKESRTERLENTQRVLSKFPVPPPLPMSPSESWLCRTLPSLPTKNSSLRPYLGNGNPRNQAFKVPSDDPKWETMVKTTKGHHNHLRYSQETMALTPIPETQ
ncbi:PREDICTED: uncharacterized protein LOC109187930 isoform X2 [Ipomoea nil]|uniref:uncharacterized protein LOC109187930 isoform X2 n=1 Tax=Ipomoea nil TaxID=35883 RepID=UPI000901BD6F|nr:PREDICTED: uncharacterized protein LOC109187930 isoform X2 [Ipomoea nil]